MIEMSDQMDNVVIPRIFLEGSRGRGIAKKWLGVEDRGNVAGFIVAVSQVRKSFFLAVRKHHGFVSVRFISRAEIWQYAQAGQRKDRIVITQIAFAIGGKSRKWQLMEDAIRNNCQPRILS